MGLLPDTQICGLRVRRECRERFSRHRLQRKPLDSDTGMHLACARAVMHVGIANLRWRGKRSRHSRRMRNPQFCVSGKRPMCLQMVWCLSVPDYQGLYSLNGKTLYNREIWVKNCPIALQFDRRLGIAALAPALARCQTGDKSLTETMMNQIGHRKLPSKRHLIK